MPAFRILAACAFLFPFVYFVGHSLATGWSLAFSSERAFPVLWGWLVIGHLVDWLFPVVFFIAVSIVLSWLLPTRRFPAWALGFAAAYSVASIVLAQTWFSPEAPWSDYVWSCGIHAMPLIGAALGVLCVSVTARIALADA